MSAAPDHSPTMSRAGLADRLAPHMPVLLIPAIMLFGVLFILSIYFFPTGIIGRLRQGR